MLSFFLETHFLYRFSKKWIVTGIIILTLVTEILVTLLIATNLGWEFTGAHFMIGFLVFIFVWFMQFNEYIGNQYSNVDNRVFGDGKDIYSVTFFGLS